MPTAGAGDGAGRQIGGDAAGRVGVERAVEAGAAVDVVVAGVAGEAVVAGTAEQQVGAVAARYLVVALEAVDGVDGRPFRSGRRCPKCRASGRPTATTEQRSTWIARSVDVVCPGSSPSLGRVGEVCDGRQRPDPSWPRPARPDRPGRSR